MVEINTAPVHWGEVMEAHGQRKVIKFQKAIANYPTKHHSSTFDMKSVTNKNSITLCNEQLSQ